MKQFNKIKTELGRPKTKARLINLKCSREELNFNSVLK